VYLSASMEGKHLIGIDLGGTKIEGVVLDAARQVVVRRRIATEQAGGYEHIVARIAALVAELRRSAGDRVAIGIGTPGSVTRAGTMKNCNTTCLNGRALPEDLAAAIGLPVTIENDANCFALAEAVAGTGQGAAMVFGVILGTGVGGGIVFRGELLRGPQSLAGEWGHHCLDPAGPPCYCGQRGCAEVFLSGPALAEAYGERLGSSSARAEEVIALARAGDPIAAGVVGGYLQRFGRALANVIDILDPDTIVIGGGLSNLDELYQEGRAQVARCIFNDELRTPIVRHQLGDSAGVIGAAMVAAQRREP